MTQLTRRNALKATALSLAASQLPLSALAQGSDKHKTLILIEFHGGNDSLNMVIPFKEQAYYDARPTIQITQKQQLPISDKLALHPKLKPLLKLYENNDLALVQGLGYAKANRSHFRSIEIWDTASRSNEYLDTGWLGQANSDQGNFISDAIVIGRNALPVSSADNSVIIIDSIERFYKDAQAIEKVTPTVQQSALNHLIKTQNNTKEAAIALSKKLASRSFNLPSFGETTFAKQLNEVAKLILLGHSAPVIKLALGGFDTHQNQLQEQGDLLKEFADGIAQFEQAMRTTGHWQNITLMTYSEFGRRVAENGSGGTDHGTAATHLVLGGAVKGGEYGTMPSLNDLSKGDLKYQHDFKQYYQTLANWLGAEVNLSEQVFDFV